MTTEEFNALSKRDFENGAIIDEIYEIFKEKTRLEDKIKKALTAINALSNSVVFSKKDVKVALSEIEVELRRGLEGKDERI